MNKIEYVYQYDQYSGVFPPGNFKDFIKFFNEILSNIPKEYQDNAQIDISSHCGNDYYTLMEISVWYTRSETDIESERSERQKQKELKILEELKRKYEQ